MGLISSRALLPHFVRLRPLGDPRGDLGGEGWVIWRLPPGLEPIAPLLWLPQPREWGWSGWLRANCCFFIHVDCIKTALLMSRNVITCTN